MDQERYTFVDGPPLKSACREYTIEELHRILEVKLTVSTPSEGCPKVAVLVSGLPGCGKTTLATVALKMLAESGIPVTELVQVDCDELRLFHGQYRKILQQRTGYRGLVDWFMTGSRFVYHVFQNRVTGLMPTILARGYSFVLHAVMDTEENFKFADYVRQEGYTLHTLHISVPVDVAIARAEDRAQRSGRWTASDFIASREAGLTEWLPRLAQLALSTAGTVMIVDNTKKFDVIAPQLQVLHRAPAVEQDVGLYSEISLAHLPEVLLRRAFRSLAQRLLEPIFATLPGPKGLNAEAISFCLAGGCFRALVHSNAGQGDLDLWPLSKASRAFLINVLSAQPGANVTRNLYNDRIVNKTGTVVEVVKRIYPSLDAVLASFDLILSVAGVAFQVDWSSKNNRWALSITHCQVHPQWAKSLRDQRVHVITPMPNRPFLLATAERCVRYAAELHFPTPESELAWLVNEYQIDVALSSTAALDHFHRYMTTTRGGEAAATIQRVFHLSA